MPLCISELETEVLTDFGISSDAEIIWNLLISGPLTSSHILNYLGMDQEHVQSGLVELQACGAVFASGNDEWETRSPIEVYRALMYHFDQDWARRRQELARLRGRFHSLQRSYLTARASACGDALTLQGSSAIEGHLARLTSNSVGQVKIIVACVCDGQLGWPAISLDRAVDIDGASGIQVVTSPKIIEGKCNCAASCSRIIHAAETRVSVGRIHSMVVSDELGVILPLDARAEREDALLLGKQFTSIYSANFELVWSNSIPLEAWTHRTAEVSGREQQILTMLARGATDAEVGHRLGISTRTVRSVIARVSSRLGAPSRMALGFQLSRYNALPIE